MHQANYFSQLFFSFSTEPWFNVQKHMSYNLKIGNDKNLLVTANIIDFNGHFRNVLYRN